MFSPPRKKEQMEEPVILSPTIFVSGRWPYFFVFVFHKSIAEKTVCVCVCDITEIFSREISKKFILWID